MLRKVGAVLCAGLLVLLECGPVLAATLFQQLPDTTTTVLTLTTLTNGSRSANGTTIDWRQAGAGKGYLDAYIECVLTFSAAPTAATGVTIWALGSNNGTNFEDSDTTRLPNATCPVRNQTANRVGTRMRLLPLRYQFVAVNDGTGQTISSGTISATPITIQGNP